MTKTTNYQLNQWEKTDRIMMDDFNADNEKIDAALGRLEQNLNCRVVFGSYTGDGKTERSITFDGTPLAVFIQCDNDIGSAFFQRGCHSAGLIARGSSIAASASRLNVSWSGNSVTWTIGYTEHTAEAVLNEKNRPYHYVALLAVGEVPAAN